MGKIIGSVKRIFSKRSKASEEHDSLGVVEDSPYYPFCWREKENGEYAAVLYAEEEYQTDIFEEKELLGNGYTWEALAKEFIKYEIPEADEVVEFDPEADMFYAYSKNRDMLYRFMTELKTLCEDDDRLRKLLDNVDADANLL